MDVARNAPHGTPPETSEGPILEPQTVRELDREHQELMLAIRALATMLRETAPAEVDDEILARILDAELNQIEVIDGELMTAVRLEKGDPGPLARLDLSKTLASVVAHSGRITILSYRGAAPVVAHRRVVEQLIASALAIAHRVADGAVRAYAQRRGDAARVVICATVRDGTAAMEDQRAHVALVHRFAQVEGGRFEVSIADDELALALEIPEHLRR